MTSLVNTPRRYLVTKTKWTCILKTQCLPCRISLSLPIDQEYDCGVQRLQAFKYELMPDGGQLATFSDGTYLKLLNSFKQLEDALRKAQQAMSRKVKYSNNWKKAKAKIQQLHVRIANARRDYLHKATTTISQNHALVCIEDLQVRNMSASAAGDSEAPGKNVKAKSGLNKAILDQGWFEFRRQLDYKLDWAGGLLLAVPPRNTSRTCPCCDHVSKDNRRTQAQFLCVICGLEENADVVGAINVLRAGHARLACEVNGATKPSAAGTHRSDSNKAPCPA